MNWKEQRRFLEEGETIKIRPQGESMVPLIGCGDLVTIEPASEPINKGDIVFCKVHGKYYVHLVQAVQQKMGGYRYQIGNNKNRTNGTIGFEHIYGKVTHVEEKPVTKHNHEPD